MDRSRALTLPGCIFARHAVRRESGDGRPERIVGDAARKQPVTAETMQPVPVMVASTGWPFETLTTRSPSDA